MKKKLAFLGIVALVALMAFPATALAAKPAAFTADGFIVVTEISGVFPAGRSGRVRITTETSAGILVSAPFAGKLLSLSQKSNERFDSLDLTIAKALDGSSIGTFVIVDPADGVVATGKYHLNVSNIPGCQIFSEGNWSTTGGGLKGRGTVTSCLNFVPALGTFAGPITFTGTLN